MKRSMFALCALLGMQMIGADLQVAPERAPDITELQTLNVKLLDKLAASVADVEYFFKLDENGKMPEFSVGYMCPNCSNMHYRGVEELIEGQTPMLTNAFAVAADEFITSDIGLQSQWLDRIEVVFKGKRYNAKVVHWYPERQSLRLKTDKPVEGIVPLQFKEAVKDQKLFSFYLVSEAGIPVAGVAPYAPGRVGRLVETANDTVEMTPNTLIVDADGNVVGISMTDELPLAEVKNHNPQSWGGIPDEERQLQMTEMARKLGENVFAARIRLAPEDNLQPQNIFMMGRDDETRSKTEVDTAAIKLENGLVLVFGALQPEVTARFERVTLFVGDKTVNAKFIGNLKDFNALLVKPEEELPGAGLKIYPGRLTAFYQKMIYGVQVKNYGEFVEIKAIPTRIAAFNIGFKGMLMPQTLRDRESTLLVSSDGELLAASMVQRKLQYEESSFSEDSFMMGSYNNGSMVPGETLLALTNPDGSAWDTANVPLPPEQRKRIAWLGVDTQNLDRNLALANKAAKLTDNGEKGLLVTRVYPDSPAAAMGLANGDILLGVQPEDGGQMISLSQRYGGMDDMMGRDFPWEQYDEIPEMYFDSIPAPWGSAESGLNRLLSRVGIGKSVKLGIVHDGKLEWKSFTIQLAPPTFDSAKRFSDKDFGFTAADLTYEVRNYFRLTPEDAGVVVAKVRPGSKASVAGLKPYEIITAVNDVPVKNVEELEKLIKDSSGELRLGVRRLSVSRIVSLTK